MPKFEYSLENNSLFLVEYVGDTMIVTPRGDPAGFANLNFQVEHSALLAKIQKGDYEKLLVDLGNSNYFGAKILGAIADWSHQVSDRNGVFALCGLLPDMRELLQIFHFEDRWTEYPTREDAVAAVVHETPWQYACSHWRAVATVMLLCVVCLAVWLPWNEYYLAYQNQQDYQAIQAVWDEMQTLRSNNASPVEWRRVQGRAHRELGPLLKDLEARATGQSRQARVARSLFMACDHNILKWILPKTTRTDRIHPTEDRLDIFWETADVHMEFARRIMANQSVAGLAFPDDPKTVDPAAPESSGTLPTVLVSRKVYSASGDPSEQSIPPAVAERVPSGPQSHSE